MKIVYPVCCGIDVHKTFLVATIVSAQHPPTLRYEKKRFSTFHKDLLTLRDWLLAHNCLNVCMESTGKYWVPVLNVLEKDLRVVVVNPKWVRAVKGNKDDVKDSKWIGELFCFGIVRESFIPEKPIRILREFTRYRSKLVSARSSEKNRFQNGFTVCNVTLDAVVSDMFGKSASKITDYLLKTESPVPEECVSFLHRSMLKKAPDIVDSLTGFQMTAEQKLRMLIIREHMEFIDKQLHKIDVILDELVKPYEAAINLLCSIPGIRRETATTIISEIGTDMSQFSSSKRLCCWAGLTPGSNESAGKKKSVKITRAGVYLKPALVEAAHAAVKCKSSSYYSLKYERIAKRRGKKRAIIAIARMILTAIYHMFVTGEKWNPSDLNKFDMPSEIREKKRKDEIRRAINFLREEGVLTDEALPLSDST